MARACCVALGGFAAPAADRGFVCSAQHEEVTVLVTLSSNGFGKLSKLNEQGAAPKCLLKLKATSLN